MTTLRRTRVRIAARNERGPERAGVEKMTTLQEFLGNTTSVGVWNLVPDRSTVAFMTKSMYGLVPVKGRFHEFSGDGQITDAPNIFGRVDIKAASLDTKLNMRDKHLRSADFFDVEKYPDISVVVTSAEGIGSDTVDLRANLTVKGTTAPVPLHAKVAVLDDGAVRVTAAGRHQPQGLRSERQHGRDDPRRHHTHSRRGVPPRGLASGACPNHLGRCESSSTATIRGLASRSSWRWASACIRNCPS